jgi:hypothetical protein
MKTKRTRATKNWHLIETIERGEDLSSCGMRMGAQHFRAHREHFEALPKGARCEACDVALAAYKTRLLAEVAEIERRDRMLGRV